MKPQTAIRPDAFIDYRKVIDKAQPETPTELLEENQLAKLSNTEGWTVLRKYIQQLKSDLGNINKSMMERGASFDEIGKNAVIVELAGELLTQIVQKVDDAREAVERQPRT
jgi:hypothetical protein